MHLPDGTAILAGAGLVVRGVWERDDRENLPPQRRTIATDKRRCVDLRAAVDRSRYRNSDGVEFCLGPCPN